MKGFKDSTKTQYSMGGSCYAKGGSVKGAAKISKVMGEFKSGELHSGSKKGPVVTNPKQATAIALSEARKAGAKIPVKKNRGGSMMDDGGAVARGNRMQALEAKEEAGMIAEGRRKAAREMRAAKAPAVVRETTVTREVTPVDRAERAARAARAAKAQKGTFMREPIVRDIMGAMGLKKGGLAVMPKGKC